MIKIGILAFGSEDIGGAYQYAQSIIDALKEDKNKNYIIFCNQGDARFDSYKLEVRKIDKPHNKISEKIIRVFQQLFCIRRPWFFTKNELDIFADIDTFLSPSISTYPHFYLNKPFVFTLHDMQERYFPEFFNMKEKAVRWLSKRILTRNADKIICESNFVKKDIINFMGVDESKISVIQSPPPEIFLNFKFEEKRFQIVKDKYNLNEKFIFYPAQCWFHKNHFKLVEAFMIVSKTFDDVNLILTGSKMNNYNNLTQKIDMLSLQDRVKHLGYIDYEDLPYFYKMSQFLVMPTLFESVSIPIYEAFALEVAVWSSNVVALPEQVGDAGLIFDPNDIHDMASNMIKYLEDDNLRKEKAKQGLERVKGFNHEDYRIRLLDVFV